MKTVVEQGSRVSREELARAEEGLIRLLHAKRFPREWIERNVPDLMAQARMDFAARLAAGRDDETVNLLVVIGYRRATKLLDAQLSAPPITSIEDVFHLADEASPTPEEEAIERDRQEHMVRAMSHLPERERALLALVYFDGKSIRDAGRRLGWAKSSADRHHQAALERLHEMLDRSLLSPEIAIPAFIAAHHWRHGPLRGALQLVCGGIENLGEALMFGGGRYAQAAEAGSAAAAGGAGRTAAGLCGAALAICLTGAAGGIIGPGVGALGTADGAAAHKVKAHLTTAVHAADTSIAIDKRPPPGSTVEARTAAHQTRESASLAEGARTPQHGAHESNAPTPASTRQTVEEFGVESGGGAGESEPVGEGSPVSEAAPAPSARPTTGGSGSTRSSGSGSSSSGGSTEFGM